MQCNHFGSKAKQSDETIFLQSDFLLETHELACLARPAGGAAGYLFAAAAAIPRARASSARAEQVACACGRRRCARPRRLRKTGAVRACTCCWRRTNKLHECGRRHSSCPSCLCVCPSFLPSSLHSNARLAWPWPREDAAGAQARRDGHSSHLCALRASRDDASLLRPVSAAPSAPGSPRVDANAPKF